MGKRRKKMMTSPVFECIKCSKAGNKQLMMEHFVRAHVTGGRAPWSCSKCGFRALSKQALHRHEGHFIHKSAEKQHPSVPTTYIKSNNPYVVRVGQDIIPVNDAAVGDINDDGQTGCARKFGEDGTMTFKRRWSDMDDSDREARFQDYDTCDSPDVPNYDTCDERGIQTYDYNHEKRPCRNYQRDWSRFSNPDQFPSPQPDVHIPHVRDQVHTDTSNYELSFSPTDIAPDLCGHVKPTVVKDKECSTVHSECLSVKKAEDGEVDVGPVLETEMSTNSRNDLSLDISSSEVGYSEVPHGARCTSVNPSELLVSNARERKCSELRGQAQTSHNTHVDRRHRNIKGESGVIQGTEPERVATSSSTTGKISNCHVKSPTLSESSSCGRVCNTPRSVDTSAVVEILAASRKDGASGPSRTWDQLAEAGSSCLGGRDMTVPTTTGDKAVPTTSVDKAAPTTTGGTGDEPEPYTSSAEFHRYVSEERDEVEDEDDPESHNDDLSESRMLEEKVNDLVAALEPLKNISKALIAIDHHMRRLLPLIENLTKDNFKKQK
ncbi:uncharacterized protein LOC124148440 [Haliotis rufescens]|uniref:uncharacterized protein LOC124148440 n=1 Tax=Haliotis rufescens TaxID=6454 RepID=UPI00201F7567|nr:uncharacterized protein LOC124148440 [Haliotis rufescens]